MSRTAADADTVVPRERRWLRVVGYLLIVAVMAGFTVKFGQEAWAAYERQQQVAAAQAAVRSQTRAIARLQHELKAAQAPGFVHQEARSWGYVDPGEALVSIDFKRHRPVHRVHRAIVRPKPAPVWAQWWNSFFGS